ncbi:uncharacterized protein PgNI_00029 [Pyricularia grisea]|uniref:Uncharacterized protein n=1 Tax=Pyricularia grisea TaxID=148305 RepID=A0A6P8BKM0_PYRGI|nr:uncharacterized protein PgNI_00029 [Pyricularia grisea]TLD17441.1 hypothetical protein PgNI_00029 [Pyricularia grisea]
MQFPQFFIIMTTVYTAAVRASCSDPVDGSCPLKPLQGIWSCSTNNTVV